MSPMRCTLVFPALLLAASAVAAQPTRGARTPAVPGPGPDVTMGLVKDPRITAALAEVSPARIRYTDSVLVSFGTRHTMSDTISDTRGIGAARRFLYNELRALSRDCGGCLRVEYDAYDVQLSLIHISEPTRLGM